MNRSAISLSVPRMIENTIEASMVTATATRPTSPTVRQWMMPSGSTA